MFFRTFLGGEERPSRTQAHPSHVLPKRSKRFLFMSSLSYHFRQWPSPVRGPPEDRREIHSQLGVPAFSETLIFFSSKSIGRSQRFAMMDTALVEGSPEAEFSRESVIHLGLAPVASVSRSPPKGSR